MGEVGRCAVLGVGLAVGFGGVAACGSGPEGAHSLRFHDRGSVLKDASVKVEGVTRAVRYRLYSGIPYVAAPVDAPHQILSVRVPVQISGRAVESSRAPILLDNSSSGKVADDQDAAALASGFVVVASAVRAGEGNGIVDLKAAVRYVRHNKGRLPGNVDRIIATGNGAGGGLAALLGASGGRGQYDDALDRLGAADASDRVYAVAASGPVTNLGGPDLKYDRSWLMANYLQPSGARYLKGLSEEQRALYLKRNPWIGWMGGRISFTFPDFLKHVGTTDVKAAADVQRRPVLRNAMDFVRQRNPARARHWWLRAGTADGDVPLTVVGNLASGLESLGDDVRATVDWDGTGRDAGSPAFLDWITRTAARRSR
ncbi:hypothetical protein [Actinomadura gamaensis]|uniref:BD-FAE-like domain-containing protein n=1 Tax=Actinomadura gamaensis TaxID=1763541 RepID=A0ABV9U3R9_9ACTN